jgi:PBP1b-binding outer membrane lipoprotein LpoB
MGMVFLVMAGTGIVGCANYKLGKYSKTPFSSITVQPIENETFAAQAQSILNQQLNDSLAQESGLRVAATGGQATLRVRITSYTHTVSATRSDDTVLGSSYTLRMTALCTLTDNNTGEVYFKDREIRASADAHVTGNYSSTEYQTMPIITRELARKIKDSVVSTW